MKKLRVAVICGGVSSERDISRRSGAQVFTHLDRNRFVPLLIEISARGVWMVRRSDNRTIRRTIDPLKIQKIADVVFNALHGTFGEDGRVQSLLEIAGIPYTGSGVLASALAMDKYKTCEFLRGHGIRMPETRVLTQGEYRNAKTRAVLIRTAKYPCVVKPNASGSSVGLSLVRRAEEMDKALRKALKEDASIVIQRYIKGREITCSALGNEERGLRALPPAEIISHADIFDYHAKYASQKTEELCPAPINGRLTKKVQELVCLIHTILGCNGLTRCDFILSNGKYYFLEINTLPGLTEQSICPKEAKAAGMTLTDFFSKQIDLA